VRTNARRDKVPVLLEVREEVEAFKVVLQLRQGVKAFPNPNAFEHTITHPGVDFDSEPVKKSSAGDRQAVVNMRSLSHEQRAFAVS